MTLLDGLYPGDATLWFVADVLVIATGVMIVALVLAWRRPPAWRHSVLSHALWLALLSPLLVWASQALELPRASTSLPTLVEHGVPAGASSWIDPMSPAAWPMPEFERELAGPTVAPPPPSVSWLARIDGKILLASIAALWLLGALLGAVKLAHGIVFVARLRRRTRPAFRVDLGLILGEVQSALHASRLPPLVCGDVESPVAVGCTAPIVVIPQCLLRTLSRESLRDVLIHEYAHAVRRDGRIGLLQRCVAIAMWPHPLIYAVNRELSRAREELCDNHVLEVSDAPSYAETLLAVARGRPAAALPALSLSPHGFSLEERVCGLLDPGRPSMTRLTRISSLAATSALLLAAAAAASHTFQVPPRESGAEPGVSGRWDGGWGEVMLRRERGTYANTWNGTKGTMRFARTGPRAYSGFFKESDAHGGTMQFVVSENGEVIEGSYAVHERAQHRPGFAGTFRWQRLGDLPQERRVVADPEADREDPVRGHDRPPEELLREILTKADPSGARDVTVADVLGRAYERVTETPEDSAEVNRAVALALLRAGDNERALLMLRRALELAPDHVATLRNLATVLQRTGRKDEADVVLQRAMRIDPQDATTLRLLGASLLNQSKHDEAESVLRRAVELSTETLGEDHPETANSLSIMAELMKALGRYEEAEACLERALEMQRRVLGDDHPDTCVTLSRLGATLAAVGRLQEAMQIQREALAKQADLLGAAHPETTRVRLELADVHMRLGEMASAEELLRETLEQAGGLPNIRARAQRLLGEVLLHQGRMEEAREYLQQATSRKRAGK